MLIDLIIENENSEQPDQDGLVNWADTYGLTIPVLADEAGETTLYSYATGSIGLPYKVLYDHGVLVDTIGSPTDDDIERLLSSHE